MTAFDQLLTGLTLGCLGFMLLFAYLWQREIERHMVTRASRDGLRESLRKIGVSPFRDHPLADALLSVTIAPPKPLRLADEQSMVNAIRDADHHDMQGLK